MPDVAAPPLSYMAPPRMPDRWRYRPIASAIWRALRLPLSELLVPPPAGMTALDLAARMLVLRATAGDVRAFAQIVDRIEGKAGLRADHADEDTYQHRAAVQATIEGIAEAMTGARIQQATLAVPVGAR